MTPDQDLPGMIRPLLPEERGTLASLLLRLDRVSRRRRFGHAVDDDFIESHARRIDWDRAFVLGYFEGGALRGAVEAAWPAVEWLDGAAEIAVQVEAGWRRRGVASALLTATTRLARSRGISGIFFSALAENVPLRRLVGGFGIPFALVGTELEGHLELCPAAPVPAGEMI